MSQPQVSMDSSEWASNASDRNDGVSIDFCSSGRWTVRMRLMIMLRFYRRNKKLLLALVLHCNCCHLSSPEAAFELSLIIKPGPTRMRNDESSNFRFCSAA
ncbi:hypothetical protein OS493_009528 [Desmophyllum pertusum]|uniref:Uncharacterized protein n=1 Tax=Desmophyllum pertusum TaxID=174260 RepID=A0A9W9Z6D1_9CNID|nr:hypothetical protein OS493_009528 [Desmophyllum pertusum]